VDASHLELAAQIFGLLEIGHPAGAKRGGGCRGDLAARPAAPARGEIASRRFKVLGP
jgi:hypothetical protein